MRVDWTRGAALVWAAALLLLPGCIFDADEKGPPPKPESNFLPLTDKESVIHNLLESYEWIDIDRYAELLHDEYVWHNQEEDVLSGRVPKAFYTRDEDVTSTENLFNAANGQASDPLKIVDRLELSIESATWQQNADLGIEDCWETTRLYRILVELPTMTMVASGWVKFLVVPVSENDRKLYKLYRAYDLSYN